MTKFLSKIPPLLILLILGAIFVRVYRTQDLLGFYFDQGRDAKVIWDFWHNGDFFLIGPTTGIEGIFRGPWYYWLIAPFYLIGGGDPVWPAVFLAFSTGAAVFILYYLARQVGGEITAYFAVVIASFSFFLVTASRWLSNPTPMFLISMLLVWSLFLIIDGRKWAWVMLSFLLGMAMQFGSAVEVFLFPAALVFAFWQRDRLSKKILFYSLGALLVTFLPQIVFDIRNSNVLSSAIAKFLFKEESFKLSLGQIVALRVKLYFEVFYSKLFPAAGNYRFPFLIISSLGLIFNYKRIIENEKLLVLVIFFFSGLLGMFFFQGNNGSVYDYYFTGYYLMFVLLFAVSLGFLSRHPLGLLVTVLFFAFFLRDNLTVLRNYLSAGVDESNHVTLGNQLQVVEWVLNDVSSRGSFNVDVYVPPVIPHSYDYLFLWQTDKRCGQSRCNMELEERVPLLYTIYEVDPPHPERLEAWLARQGGIGVIEEAEKFGGITVERRKRIPNDQ